MATVASPPDAGRVKKPKLEETLVKLEGKKLRAGTVPWRYVGQSEIEVFLIEGLNTPGFWTFPAGSLDPGEEVSRCASRETFEECGARGNLGCFLGVFEEKNRTYLFAMEVTSVDDAGNDIWHDPHSSYEGSGDRRRGWFSPESAWSRLKKDGPAMLETFLAVPVHQRRNLRRPREIRSKVQLCILGVGESVNLVRKHCSQKMDVEILPASVALTASSCSEAQKFAIVAATLWEAHAVVCVGGKEILYALAMASSSNCATLFVATEPLNHPWMLEGDSRVVSTHLLSAGSWLLVQINLLRFFELH